MRRVVHHSSVTPLRPARTLALPAIAAVLSVSALPLIVSACESGLPPNAPTLPSAPEREAVLGDAGAPRAATQPDAAHAAPMNARTLFVRESYAECEGEGRMRCLQVRETDHAEWTLFYGRIEGFTYEEGLRYELRVESVASAGPRADAPRRHLRLIEILSKAKP
jgi:hypothetical protein